MKEDPVITALLFVNCLSFLLGIFFGFILCWEDTTSLSSRRNWTLVEKESGYECYEAPFKHVQRGSYYCYLIEPEK